MMQNEDVSCGRNEDNTKSTVRDKVVTNGPQGGTVQEERNVNNL